MAGAVLDPDFADPSMAHSTLTAGAIVSTAYTAVRASPESSVHGDETGDQMGHTQSVPPSPANLWTPAGVRPEAPRVRIFEPPWSPSTRMDDRPGDAKGESWEIGGYLGGLRPACVVLADPNNCGGGARPARGGKTQGRALLIES